MPDSSIIGRIDHIVHTYLFYNWKFCSSKGKSIKKAKKYTNKLMQSPKWAEVIDLWLNKLQIRKKMYPPMMPIVCTWGRKVQTRTLFFPRENFSLSLISVQKDCLASLRSADICPSSLRSRKVKSSPAERKVRPRLYSFPGNYFPSRRNIYSLWNWAFFIF